MTYSDQLKNAIAETWEQVRIFDVLRDNRPADLDKFNLKFSRARRSLIDALIILAELLQEAEKPTGTGQNPNTTNQAPP